MTCSLESSDGARTCVESFAERRKKMRFAGRVARGPYRSGIVSWISVIDGPERSGRI